jgi:uncharacterized protein
MRILITGSRGLIGSALTSFLSGPGHQVVPILRGRPRNHDNTEAPSGTLDLAAGRSGPEERPAFWDPDRGEIDRAALEGADAVIHLSGENLAAGRWSRERKARLVQSRVQSTRVLCRALGQCARPPSTLVCASAIGHYGHGGDEILTEESPPGRGFLAELVRAWEDAARPAGAAGIRVVHLRLGLVLSPGGGALSGMLPLFRLGLGARLGSGQQWMSWVALDDVIGAVEHVLTHSTLDGPVNVVAPCAVRNCEFTRTLAGVLSRPAFFVAWAPALRLFLGEMADEMLLAGARVQPTKLIAAGYGFRFPLLKDALQHLLSDRE